MIISYLNTIRQRLGIDKAIFYTSLSRVIQAGGGLVSILFIARYLTEVEQGFYYTFASIVAIQVFFELGLNGIITQFVAHEVVHLRWEKNIYLTGEQKYLSRLASLLHFSVKWYLCFALLLLCILFIVGYLFFTKYHNNEEHVTWLLPWAILAIGTSLHLLFVPLLAFFEGLGKVKEVARMRLFQQTMSLLAVWVSLVSHGKLYTSGINVLVGISVISLLFYLSDFRKTFKFLWQIPIIEKIDYKKEIFPFQWKIALSWISSYFVFQLFNPVLFATEGAIVAGQMGMTLAGLIGIQALSTSWMTTKIPLYSGMIAQKQYASLNQIFNKTLNQSVFINGFSLVMMFVVVYLIKHFQFKIGMLELGNRFLGYVPMVLMMIPLFVNQYISSWATYLRCHKQEPFLIHSMVAGVSCCLSTILLGKYYGVLGITAGYCTITILLAIWGYRIFKTKKEQWHE